MRPPALHPGAIQGKEGIKFCYLATLCTTPFSPRPTDPRCNKRRHSFSPVPSFLACSISLPPLSSHIIMKEGKHFFAPRFLIQLPLSPCHGRVGLFVPLKLCHSQEMLPAFPNCCLCQSCIRFAIGRPAYYRVIDGRHISRQHLPHPPLSDPPPSFPYVWFGAFVVVHHHVSE